MLKEVGLEVVILDCRVALFFNHSEMLGTNSSGSAAWTWSALEVELLNFFNLNWTFAHLNHVRVSIPEKVGSLT